MEKVYLLEAGQIIIAESPACIRTILGSCVSVTFFDKEKGISAIMHGIYPGEGKDASYTETAIHRIVSELKRRDIPIGKNLEIKLFGGANMNFPDTAYTISNAIRVDNIASAKRVLKTYGLKIVVEDTGCSCGREIRFYTSSGDVYVKKLKNCNTCNSPECKDDACRKK